MKTEAKSLLVVGTYPKAAGPLLTGEASLDENGLVHVGDIPLTHTQGIAPLLGAACQVASHFGMRGPQVVLGGDIGRGDGTRDVFQALRPTLESLRPGIIAFHYMQPVMSLMREAMRTIDEVVPDAMIVADAGGMYAIKPIEMASRVELMTPDVGELGFLADEEIHHPAYVSRYLFGNDGFDAEALAVKAFMTGGASRVLLVKGEKDHVVVDGRIVTSVEEPSVPALEAIGGTGDTLTGLACGFMSAGFPTEEAAKYACLANRAAGARMGATPAMHSGDLVAELSAVLDEMLTSPQGSAD